MPNILQPYLSTALLGVIGASLIYFSAMLDVSISFTPVPQTAQTLALVVLAAWLPRSSALLSIVLYLLFGLFGLPVFSDGGSGMAHFLGPTGGYLLGFLLAVIYIVSVRPTRPLAKTSYRFLFLIFVIAHAIILFFGCLLLSRYIGFSDAVQKGVTPFILGGLLKSGLGVMLIFLIQSFLPILNAQSSSEV